MSGFFSLFSAIGLLLLLVCGVAVLPALLVVGALVLAFSIAAGVIGLVFRVLGALLLGLLAIPLMLGAFGLALVAGIAVLHAALPLLLIVGIVWLIVHHRHAPPRALP